VNSLPKTVTRQRRGCDLNPGPSAPESSTLTTRLPSQCVAGPDGKDRQSVRRRGDIAGRRRVAAVHRQRGVVRRRAGVAAVRRGGDVPRLRVQVLPGRLGLQLRPPDVLVSHARHATSRLLHHQHLHRHGTSSVTFYDTMRYEMRF